MNPIKDAALGKLNTLMKDAQVKTGEAARIIQDQQGEMIDILNDHTKALITIYKAIEKIAEKESIKLEKPLVDMQVDD